MLLGGSNPSYSNFSAIAIHIAILLIPVATTRGLTQGAVCEQVVSVLAIDHSLHPLCAAEWS